MATTRLTDTVELSYSNAWQDISTYVLQRDPIVITRGRADEGTVADPSTLNLTLDNRDGRFTLRNPSSPLYGLIGRNTPIRVTSTIPNTASIGLLLPGADANSQASTPDNAALDIVGDLDLRAEFVPRAGSSAGTQDIVTKGAFVSGSNLSYSMLLGYTVGLAHITLRWSTNGTTQTFVDHPMPEVLPGQRIAVRATLQVNNGSGGYTASFYTSSDNTISGTWTLHGSASSGVGVTSIFSGSGVLQVGEEIGSNRFVGEIGAVEVRSGIGGTVVANPSFKSKAAGTTSFTDGAGRVWTVGSSASIGTGTDLNSIRMVGEVSSWPVYWDTSGSDIYIPLTAGGITRRLGQGTPPKVVGMSAYVLGSTFDQSWPGDYNHSLSWLGNNPVFGQLQLNQCATNVSFGTGDLSSVVPDGMQILTTTPTFDSTGNPNTGYVAGYVGSTAPSIGAFFMYKAQTLGPLTLFVNDYNNHSFQLKLRADGVNNDFQVNHRTYDYDTGTAVSTLGASAGSQPALTDGQLHNVLFTLEQNGSDTLWTVNLDGVSIASGTISSFLLGGCANVFLTYAPTDPVNNPVAIGYLTIWQNRGLQQNIPQASDVALTASGYVGETAGARIQRLCEENGISFTYTGDLTDTALMGVQGSNTLLALMQEAAATDLGLLYEPRTQLGLAYRTRKSLYSQTAAVTLDYSANVFGDPPNPVDDDQGTHNDVTVTRTGGGTAEAVLTTGALSTQSPPNGVNTYPSSASVNVETSGQLQDIANWLLHLGTVDAARYPKLGLNMLNPQVSGTLAAGIAALDIGSKVVITNLPAWLPPDSVSLLNVGFTENLGPYNWTDQLNCVPGSPYEIAVYGSAQGSASGARFDAENSTVGTGFNTVATSLSIASAANTQIWTTDVAAMPFDIKIAGERMTVTAITGSSSPQTFTVTRSVNGVVKSHVAGEQVSLFNTPRFGL